MKISKITNGLMFIAAAAIIVASQFDMLGDISVFSVLVIVIMAPLIITSIPHRNFFGVFVPIAIILMVLPLDEDVFSPFPMLAVAILFSIGMSMIFPYKHKKIHSNNSEFIEDNFSSSETVTGEQINITTRFNGTVRYIESDNFSYMNIETSFGGTKIYFDKAQIMGDIATVNIEANFSGVELFVPRNWVVRDEISNTLGGVEEKGPIVDDDTRKTLVLTGRISFSGIKIIHV